MRLTAFLMLTLLLSWQAPRPTVIARISEPPSRNFRVIYYDEAFLFAGRDYGSSRDPGGNTEPGLFVHSRAEPLGSYQRDFHHRRSLRLLDVLRRGSSQKAQSLTGIVELHRGREAAVP